MTLPPPPVMDYAADMKPDIDYTRQLLEALQAIPLPDFTVKEIRDSGVDTNDDRFAFHLMHLQQGGQIRCAAPVYKKASGRRYWTSEEIYLTPAGHLLASSLRTSGVVETVKSKGDIAFDTMVGVATSAAMSWLMKGTA